MAQPANAEARLKVTTAVYRVGLGNLSNVKGVGAGVLNAESISVPDTASILEKMARRLSSFLEGERNNASKMTSISRRRDGKTTS